MSECSRICEQCKAKNPPEGIFCTKCGAKLPQCNIVYCQSCGEKLFEGEDYCPKCGTKKNNRIRKINVSKKAIIISSVCAGAILLAVVGFVTVAAFLNTHVPNVVGKTEKEAEASAKEYNCKVLYEYADGIQEGKVYKQEPEAFAKKTDDKSLVLYVSKGDYVTVPDLEGMKKEDAFTKLKELGLNYSEKDDFSDSVEKGNVIYQTLTKGNRVSPEESIELWISKGKGISTSQFIGMTFYEAEGILSKYNIHCIKDYASFIENDKKAGSIVRISKDYLAEGDTVKLFINSEEP